jgi:tRNA(fMet)-specific endonuclease VapC
MPYKPFITICSQVRRFGCRRSFSSTDLFIAAHARSLGLTLVPNNTGEFGRVQDLNIENWTARR